MRGRVREGTVTKPADLNVEHLEVRYGDLVGVADISLKVPAGKVVALLGSNGAGKTTTLNAIAGGLAAVRGADRGTKLAARLNRAGRPLTHRGAVRARLCAVPAARRAPQA